MKTLKLNNNYEIPIIGLGTYQSNQGEVVDVIKNAIDAGYRHFDCAWFYENEEEIGEGLASKLNDGTVKREELFITSKLWNNFHSKAKVVPTLKETLKALKLDYLDLYLIHWPFAFKEDVGKYPIDKGASAFSDIDYLETWEGMEDCVRQGLTKSIGVSNFNSEQISRLLKVAKIKPVVNQIEVNPNINQKKLIKFCNENKIVVTGYCPIKAGTTNSVISDPSVIAIAEKHNKTPAQIILKYLINLGISVIPKTVQKKRLLENIDLFDFELNKKDTEYMDSLNNNERVVPATEFSSHKYFPFNIEF